MSAINNKPSPAAWIVSSKCLAAATLAVVAVSFFTAGAMLQAGQLRSIHETAAIALHVLSGLLTVTLVVLARQRQHGWWAAGVALALFVFSFVQAYLGKGYTLGSHIPGALIVATASVWLVFWLFGRQRT